MTATITKDQILAHVRALAAIADAIREAGPLGISSGSLYATLMNFMSLDAYERTIGILTGSGLVRKYPSGVLTWIGPMQRP